MIHVDLLAKFVIAKFVSKFGSDVRSTDKHRDLIELATQCASPITQKFSIIHIVQVSYIYLHQWQ